MKTIRKLLLPLSTIYWFITVCRNILYNCHIFKSANYETPLIAVGNLSTGGTGKTPQTEYLIRLLKDKYNIAMLSRGYKRKTSGYVIATAGSTAAHLGDEPYQIHKKFPEINVAVDADRRNGINNLLQLTQPPQVILLDDAYQHRRVTAGLYILLTAYGDLYINDWLLPAGNLRESGAGAKRADLIVVTKCPADLPDEEQKYIADKISKQSGKQVSFTTIAYDEYIFSEIDKIAVESLKNVEKILVAGIAKPRPFFDFLASENTICKSFPDHHNFTDKEISDLIKMSEDNLIITTEKDYVRLRGKIPSEKLYYLPMRTKFISGGDVFNNKVLEYVEQNTGNS